MLAGLMDLLFGQTEEEDYEEEVSWKTFRLDKNVWSNNRYKQPGIEYTRELQTCYEQLLNEMAENYLFDIESIKERFTELHQYTCELERKLARYEGTETILRGQIGDALKYQTSSGRKAEIYQSNGLDVPDQAEPKKENNKFVSADGRSKQEKMKLAAAMKEYGFQINDIADEIGISVKATEGYISSCKKHYKTYEMDMGDLMMSFDQEFGGDLWNLDEMFEEEYCEDSHSSSSDDRGVIIKSLKTPVFSV